MDEKLFEHLGRLLDEPEDRRDALIDSFELTSEQRTRLRLLLDTAIKQDTLDGGVTAMFPTLLRPSGFPDAGYQIIREIGRGGMGVVYLAEDTRLGRYVAIKVVGAAVWDDSGEAELLHEARAAARLDHPGIVPVYHTGHLDRAVYIISAYIEGETLADSIARLRQQCGIEDGDRRPLGRGDPATSRRWVDRVIETVRDVARAVEYAHSQSVVHRDLKPSNILLDENSRPYLADFGIAKLTDKTETTRAAAPIGSLLYMSPEQVGAVTESVGPRSDVYSLGVVLFEALTLRRPFEVNSLGGLIRVFDRESPPDPRRLNPAVPRSVAAICRKALSTRPAQRHTSAKELVAELEQALLGEFAATRWSLAPARRLLRRRKIVITGTVAALLGAVAAAGMVTWKPPPRGTVRFSPSASGSVMLCEIDPVTREPGEMQRARVRNNSLRLPPGLFRVIVEDGDRAREFTRTVTAGATVKIDTSACSDMPIVSDMELIPGGVYTVGYDQAPLGSLKPREVSVAAFWIDRHEVSNAEYRLFLEATGFDPPPIWPDPYDPRWDRLPVVAVTLAEARAYAEWVGKRLPTDIEWEIAAAGPERRLYPWGDQVRVPTGMSTHSLDRPGYASDFDTPLAAQEYFRGVLEVDDPGGGDDLAWSNLLHLCGNVAEWTDIPLDGSILGFGQTFAIVKGNPWAAPDARPLYNQEISMFPPDGRFAGVGFRCAMSATDP